MVSKENLRARQLLGEFVATLTPTDHQPTPDELRAGCDHWMTTNFPAPANLRTGKVDADGVPCLWASMPGTSAERTILYLHGGAYLLGSANGYRGFAAALSRAADARVLLVDYRLAPENPHPRRLMTRRRRTGWLVNALSAPPL